MRLKCIKLAGFKSFVDPTTINFPSSLCAVVGPNGCGKSNVIDAVRWVMGESSARNLRGEHMTDVIFNGSSARKPVGQASVELIFDNQDHKLAGEYANFSEVSIKRRVDREGQSIYSLNGTRCRRRDVTDIFLGTGLGARSYSIIEQGMVSRLIESKPEELRVYIEEAAGISRYKERRKETESRIKRTRENLERLADIREELERQLQHLKRQSVAAEKYGELKRQERETTANLNGLRWLNLDAAIRGNQEQINALDIRIESTTAEQRGLDARVEKHIADNAGLTDAHGKVQARFYSLGNDIARIEQSIEHHIERLDQLKQDLTETEAGWIQTREELDIDLKKVTRLDAELGEVSPALETATGDGQRSAGQLAAAEQALQQWQQQWEQFNQRAEEPRQTAEVEQSRIQQLETIIERGLDRRQKLLAEQQELERAPVDSNVQRAAAEISRLEAALVERQATLAECGSLIETERRELDRCSEELDGMRGELQAAKGRQASLEALQQEAMGRDNEDLRRWLAEQGLDNQSRLAQNLRIEAGWELALEAVLGDSLQGICVQGPEQVDQLLRRLPRGKLALIDVSAHGRTGMNRQASLTPLADKVSSDWDIGQLMQDIYVADDLNQAVAARNQLGVHESVITADGVWLGWNWARVRNMSAQESTIKRQRLIADLSSNINVLEDKSNALLEEKNGLGAGLSAREAERDRLQGEIAGDTRELGELKSSRSAGLAKQEEAELRRQRIHHELEELERQLALEQEHIASARVLLQDALDVMGRDVGRREELEAERQKLGETLGDAREKARSDKDLAHKLALKQQAVQAQLQSTRDTMDRMASQMQRSGERIESLSGQIEASGQPLQALRDDLQALLQQRLEVEQELGAAKARVDENEHVIRDLERQRSEIQEQLTTLRDDLMQQRLKSEGASVKRDGVSEQLRDADFELDIVLQNLPEGLEEQACETELEKLANRIQRLGPINLAAVDEYRQQSERKVYLDRQNDDLEQALNTLQHAIRKIDKETRARFKETFDKINAGLQNLFPKVFGGGNAYLDMTGDDLLDTGVAIMARPPGKRNSTIHLLSGGEKAMTAIALVFSIFHLNPSPFCMLDEVDAPLDDANVSRYANLVKEMAGNLQFIFITHNKITMEMAKQLLGVTMHEAGVSRIVAVDIDEAAELAAM